MSTLVATKAIQTITICLNCLAFCQKFGRPGDCLHLMKTSACQVSSIQGNAYLDDRKLAEMFFLVSRQKLGDLSSTENECPICPLTIKGCVRRKPSICICSCAHPFAKKNSAHLIQREWESHLSLAMYCCCVRKNIPSVFVVLLNFWPTRKNGRLSSKDNDEGPIRPRRYNAV